MTPVNIFVPRPWHNIFPLLLLFLGLHIGHRYPPTYDVIFFCVLCYYHAGALIYYLTKAGVLYQHYSVERKLKELDEGFGIQKKITNLNEKKPVQVMTYEQRITSPKFRKEKHFAEVVMKMKDFGYKVDITERRWVLSGKFTRNEWVEMMDKWRYNGLISRKNGKRNSPYEIVNWEKVKAVSTGAELPPPPFR